MFPILTAAAVVSPVQLPAEGTAEAAVLKSPENAFGTAVEQAFAKGRPDTQQGVKAQPPEEAEGRKAGTDPAASAWAAGWILQPAWFTPLAQEQAAQAENPALSLSAAANPASATASANAVVNPAIPFGATGYLAGATSPNAVVNPAIPFSATGCLAGATTPNAAVSPAISFGATRYPADTTNSSSAAVSPAIPFDATGYPAGAPASPSTAVNPTIPFGDTGYPAGATSSPGAAVGPAIPFGAIGYPAGAMSSPGAAVSPAGAVVSSSTTIGLANAVIPLGAAGNRTSTTVLQGAAVFAEMTGPERTAIDLKRATTLSASVALPGPTSLGGAANPANTGFQGNRANPARAAEGSATIPADAPSAPAGKVLSGDARAASAVPADAKAASQQPPAREQLTPLEQARAGRAVFAGKTTARQSVDGTPPVAASEFKAPLEPKDAAEAEAGGKPEGAARLETAESAKREVLPELRAANPATQELPEAPSEPKPGTAFKAVPAQQPAEMAGAAALKPEALPAAPALQVPQDFVAERMESAAETGLIAEPKASGRAMDASPGAGAARAGSAQPAGEAAQAAGQYARVQAAARQETAGKPQSFEAEPERERTTQTTAGKRPEGDPAGAPGAVFSAHAGQGAPRTEQASAAAPADAPRSTIEPNAAMQLARATAGAMNRGESEYRLRLRPEGVGEVAVTIISRDRDLHLTIHTASESTRDLILNQIGGLKEELTAGGYHLNGFSVDVSGGGQGGQAFTFQQDPGRQSGQRSEARPEARPGGAPLPKEAPRAGAPEARAGAINYRI